MTKKINDDDQRSNPVRLIPEVADKWYYPVLAPFSKHYKRRVETARMPMAERTVLEHMITLDFPKVVFTKNPKAACTTVANAIYMLSSGRKYESDIHHEAKILTRGRDHWDTLRLRHITPAYVSFTFVRHPIDRLESAFRNFVLEGSNRNVVHHAVGFKEFGCHPDKSANENLDAFLDYVGASLALSRLRTDPHWRLQVDNIGLGLFDYDFIGRVENLQDDMRKVFTMAGADQAAIEQVTAIRENASRTSGRIANDAQCARIRRLYAEDFEAFGYD